MGNTKDKKLTNNKEKTWCVYIHTNMINGKKYVGITSQNPKYRWQVDGSGYKTQSYFWRAIQKYGWNNFKHEILLQNETLDYACRAEKCLINAYNCRAPNGYNVYEGGNVGPIGISLQERLGEEGYEAWLQKRKTIVRRGSDNPHYGVSPKERMDEETYNNWLIHIRENVLRGEEHPMYGVSPKERMSKEVYEKWLYKQKTRERSGVHNPMYGISPKERMTDEVYNKWLKHVQENRTFGEEHPWYGKRGVFSFNFKPVYCIELDEIFWGPTDAEKQYNIKAPNIIRCCQGDSKSAGKHPVTGEKLRWIYTNDKVKKDDSVIYGAITLGYITQQRLDDYINNQKKQYKIN